MSVGGDIGDRLLTNPNALNASKTSISCIKCKGNNPSNCGRTFCPIVAKAEAMFKVKNVFESNCLSNCMKENFATAAPAPFVGRAGYPRVNVGILAPQAIDLKNFGYASIDASIYDAPRQWALQDFGVKSVVDLRSALINSRFKAEIKSPILTASAAARPENKFLEISQEVGMASKPVEIELKLEQKPKFRIDYNAEAAPHGPAGILRHASITSNPKIDSRVDKVVSDIDMKAVDGVISLYNKGFDENFLSKILSVGILGMKKDRKLVPTRWSITATDDMLAKNIISELKEHSHANEQAFFGSYLGNYYLVMLFPGPWSYELFEMYLPHANWNPTAEFQYSTDYEGYGGRKEYAANTQGGYYAARLPIAERLQSMKRQASVLALRFITGEYAVPLGVWVVREAARKAMEQRPIEFSDKALMLRYARAVAVKKFGRPAELAVEKVIKNSVLLRDVRGQKRIREFM